MIRRESYKKCIDDKIKSILESIEGIRKVIVTFENGDFEGNEGEIIKFHIILDGDVESRFHLTYRDEDDGYGDYNSYLSLFGCEFSNSKFRFEVSLHLEQLVKVAIESYKIIWPQFFKKKSK